MSSDSRLASGLYVGAVAVATVVYLVLPIGAKPLTYDVIGVSAGAVMLVGARRHRREPQAAWLLLGLGVLALAGGDIVFGSGQSVPSPADMLYISAYPLLGLGFSGLSPWRRSVSSPRLVVPLFVAAVVGVLSWVFLVLPSADRRAGVATTVVALGYPVMDVVLMALLARAVVKAGFGDVTHAILGVGLVLMLVADIGYALDDLGLQYQLGGALDSFWLLAYGLFGAALLYPASQADTLWDVDRTHVAELPPTEPSVDTEEAWTPPVRTVMSDALHFADLARWSGRMSLVLAVPATIMGAAWFSPKLVLIAGAYGIIGALMIVAASLAS